VPSIARTVRTHDRRHPGRNS